MAGDTHLRSVLKAVSWRFVGTFATAGIVYLFTKKVGVSLAVGGLEFVSKIGMFWFHERLWARVPFGRRDDTPAAIVVWFTGLSGAGKSTIADQVYAQLKAQGRRVERLDGDSVRDIFPATGFTRPERDAHLKRVGFLASRLEANGVTVIASFVSPYEDSRQAVRALCGRFVEVYVSTPLQECERRDVKGLYAKARAGEVKHFTGIDDPYEPPSHPELTIDTSSLTVDAATARVLEHLQRLSPAVA